jgi:Tfp pilus assembly protein PilF
MELFELLDPTNKVFPIRARYEEALAAFERGDAEAATQRVANILSEHPSDVPAYLLQMRALQAKLNRGAAVTGVLKLMDAGS